MCDSEFDFPAIPPTFFLQVVIQLKEGANLAAHSQDSIFMHQIFYPFVLTTHFPKKPTIRISETGFVGLRLMLQRKGIDAKKLESFFAAESQD